jgi:hypothetical protein
VEMHQDNGGVENKRPGGSLYLSTTSSAESSSLDEPFDIDVCDIGADGPKLEPSSPMEAIPRQIMPSASHGVAAEWSLDQRSAV